MARPQQKQHARKPPNGSAPGKPRVPERETLCFDVRRLLRNVVDGISSPESRCLTQENLLNNLSNLRRHWAGLYWRPAHDNIFRAVCEHADAHGEVPSYQGLLDRFRHLASDAAGKRLPDGETPDADTHFELELLDAPAVVAPLIRTNFAHLLNKAVREERQIQLRADFARLSDDVNDAFRKGGNGFDLLGSAFDQFRKTYTSTDTSTFDPDNPLVSLRALGSVAVVGRDKILELASKEITYVWQDIATQGLIVLLAGGPGSGKTTLLFLLVAARLNLGSAVNVLGHRVTPAPSGKYVVVIENEHSDESAARIIVKSLSLLSIDDRCLDRLVAVNRKNVLMGSPVWKDVETLITSGGCSDVVIDTLARFAPGDANEEAAQASVFAAVQTAIEKAPSVETQPTCWVGAHARKGGSGGVDDVSGSAQRAGQVDVVLTMQAQLVDGKVRAVKVGFPKVREKDADSWPDPVTYRIGKDGITVNGTEQSPADAPLADQVLVHLKDGPKTSNALEKLTKRNHADIQQAISELFTRRTIVTTSITVAGRERKAYAVRPPDDLDGENFINGERDE